MTEIKNCSAIENELALFVGGELGPRSRAEVEAHLARCESCSREVDRLAASRSALRSGLERGEARMPDLWQGVRARLVESGTIRVSQPSAPRISAVPRRSMPRWFPLAAAAAVLLAFGMWMLQPDVQLPDSGPLPVHSVALGGAQKPAPQSGLRLLSPGESALSSSATPIEALQEEQRLRASIEMPTGTQAASQRRGIH
jgi:hypothetical protein